MAEHHDGFSMWKSTCNEWNSVDKGPKLDLVSLFNKAYRAKGMKFLVSTHTADNFTGYFQWAPAQTDPSLKKLYCQLPKADEEKLWLSKTMGWPTNNQMVITSLKSGAFDTSTISKVTFIGGDTCTWTQDATGLKVNLPAILSDTTGYAVRISFSGEIPKLN